MLLISVLVIGGIAIARLPLAYLPEVDVPFIGVQIPYPNSNPKQIEKEIVKPVEEVLSTLSGVKTLNGTASADQAEFFLEFDWGKELDIVRMQVSEKMDQIKPELPQDIGDVVIFSFNTNDIPVVQARLSAQGVDLSENYELIEARILNRIRRVPGVARVTLEGVEPREIFIDLILDRVKEHNVDVGALIDQLRGASSNLVLGQIEDGGLRFSARALGEFTSVEEISNLVINDQGLQSQRHRRDQLRRAAVSPWASSRPTVRGGPGGLQGVDRQHGRCGAQCDGSDPERHQQRSVAARASHSSSGRTRKRRSPVASRVS